MKLSYLWLFNCSLWITSTVLPTALAHPFHPPTSGFAPRQDGVLAKSFTNLPSIVSRNPGDVSGKQMRILPLGDSITWGFRSTDGCGYREKLLQDLTSSSNNVRYIGSQHSGNMSNNENEGHSGYKIAEIASATVPTLPQRPNIILLMAGTNDIVQNFNLTTAPDRLRSLIQELIDACPDAAILVAQIIPSGEDDRQRQVVIYNNALTSVVNDFATQGHHVMEVSMPTTQQDLIDGIHPTEKGYLDMGDAWFAGIDQAGKLGWIGEPVFAMMSPRIENMRRW